MGKPFGKTGRSTVTSHWLIWLSAVFFNQCMHEGFKTKEHTEREDRRSEIEILIQSRQFGFIIRIAAMALRKAKGIETV